MITYSFKLELLAIKWAMTKKFKDYLMRVTFTVYTDNNPLANLQYARLGATEQRWVAQLASYNYTVKYKAGRENTNADTLSRMSVAGVMANVVLEEEVQGCGEISTVDWSQRQTRRFDNYMAGNGPV